MQNNNTTSTTTTRRRRAATFAVSAAVATGFLFGAANPASAGPFIKMGSLDDGVTAVSGFSDGQDTDGKEPPKGPDPCEDPKGMPEYCDPPWDPGPADPKPMPEPGEFDLRAAPEPGEDQGTTYGGDGRTR